MYTIEKQRTQNKIHTNANYFVNLINTSTSKYTINKFVFIIYMRLCTLH